MSYQQQISVTTKGHGDMHDVTEQVTSVVNASGIQTGTVNVFNIGSTAAIGMIEFEPGLQHDLPFWTSSSRQAVTTVMSRRGTTATGIRTYRRHYSGHRTP